MGDEPKPEQEVQADVVLLHSPTEDGEGIRVIRARTGREPQVGELRPLREGKPLMGAEVVRLSPREGSPRVCDVEVTHEKSEAKPAWKAGPAQVTTREYRDSWDRIFGEPRDVAPVNSRSN